MQVHELKEAELRKLLAGDKVPLRADVKQVGVAPRGAEGGNRALAFKMRREQ